MKSVKKWYETLPEKIKEKALKYTDSEELDVLEPSLAKAILKSFILEETEEGEDFWRNVIKTNDPNYLNKI